MALDLLVYTGGRREDVVRLGPQHVRNSRVRFRQAKNEHRTPIDIDIPLHPGLEASIAATPSKHLTFLITEFGRPFSPGGFGNWFRINATRPIYFTVRLMACARLRLRP